MKAVFRVGRAESAIASDGRMMIPTSGWVAFCGDHGLKLPVGYVGLMAQDETLDGLVQNIEKTIGMYGVTSYEIVRADK